MSYITKIASAAILAASLAPFAAQARSGDIGTVYPAQHLVRTSDAQPLHGRAAVNAQVPANYATAPAAELANTGNNSGYAG